MTNYELLGSIRRSLHDIRTHWDALLAPVTSAGQGGAPSARITRDDHDEAEDDIDRTTRVVSLRREVIDVLNAISRWVAEDRPVTKALPNGIDAPSMIEFIERHAEWIADRDAEDDGYESTRLKELAGRVVAMTAPPRKEWHHLGACPLILTAEAVEDGAQVCNGKVRVPIGGDQSEATCSRCETKAAIRWWEEAMGKLDEVVSAVDMARIVFTSLHVRVTERTIRNWARAERITRFVPFGPQPQDVRWWFSARSVLDEVARMDRDCPMCGRVWSGAGEVCSRCYHAMESARPRHAEPKRPTPVASNLRPRHVVPDRNDTDRPQRCHFSDLPLNQCACGRRHEQVSA